MTAAVTLLIICPWLCVRRVPVETLVPSKGNVVLKFGGGLVDGFLGRVSRSLLLEVASWLASWGDARRCACMNCSSCWYWLVFQVTRASPGSSGSAVNPVSMCRPAHWT